jgi:hypothetical protein
VPELAPVTSVETLAGIADAEETTMTTPPPPGDVAGAAILAFVVVAVQDM